MTDGVDLYARELEAAYLARLADLISQAKMASTRISNIFAPVLTSQSIPSIKTHAKRVRRAQGYLGFIEDPARYASMRCEASPKGDVMLTLAIDLNAKDIPEVSLKMDASRPVVTGIPGTADAVAHWCGLQFEGANAFFEDAAGIVRRCIWAEIERKLLISQQYQIERSSVSAPRLIDEVRDAQGIIFRPVTPKNVKTRLSFKESSGAKRSQLPAYTTISGYYSLRLETNECLYEIAVSDHPKADDQMYEDVRFLCLPIDLDIDLFVNPYPNNKITLRGASSAEHLRDWVLDHQGQIKESIAKRIA